MKHTPNEHMVPGLAIAPQAIGTTAVDGVAIVRPWEVGRTISFLAIAGALAAADALTVVVQARRVGTSTWDGALCADGVTALGFTVSKLSDGGAVENGVVMGSLDLSRFKAPGEFTYDAIRLRAVNANNSSPGIIGFAYVIADGYTNPIKDLSGALVQDDLILKQLPHTLA